MIKLKDNEDSPNVQFIINGQIHEMERTIKYIFDIKDHQFAFLKPKNELIYRFEIDSICFDDLMSNNKKQKKSEYEKPISKEKNKTFAIKKNNNIDNKIDQNIKKKDDSLNRAGSNIYFPNINGKKENEKEKPFKFQGGVNIFKIGLEKGLIQESNNNENIIDKEIAGEGVKGFYQEKIIESEVDIPVYDNLNEKIINADSFNF